VDTNKDDYRISFFNPTTKSAQRNRNLTIWLVCVWAVAVFGFQILLRVIEKPIPEKALVVFDSVWAKVQNQQANTEEHQNFIKSLMVPLAKQYVTDADRKVLENAYNWSIYMAYPDSLKETFQGQVKEFMDIKANLSSLDAPEYLNAKQLFRTDISKIADIGEESILFELIPYFLSTDMTNLSQETNDKLVSVMKTYLIHNRSVLTDTSFLGFPFHYFYSAIFLLVLFVGLCWIYCFKTDRWEKKAKADIA